MADPAGAPAPLSAIQPYSHEPIARQASTDTARGSLAGTTKDVLPLGYATNDNANAPISPQHSGTGQLDSLPKATMVVKQSTPAVTTNEKQDSLAGGPSSGQAIIELLVLSGSRKRLHFAPSTTISEILAYIYKDWPESWEEKRPDSLAQLRLLHRGRFLPEDGSLSANKIAADEVTVMHLNIRPIDSPAPVPTSVAVKKGKPGSDSASHSGGCRCIVS